MLQIPQLVNSARIHPAGWIGLGITLSLIAYAIYVRRILFPNMRIFSARRGKDGNYVFA